MLGKQTIHSHLRSFILFCFQLSKYIYNSCYCKGASFYLKLFFFRVTATFNIRTNNIYHGCWLSFCYLFRFYFYYCLFWAFYFSLTHSLIHQYIYVREVVDLFTDEVSIVSLPLVVFLKRTKIEMCQQAPSLVVQLIRFLLDKVWWIFDDPSNDACCMWVNINDNFYYRSMS